MDDLCPGDLVIRPTRSSMVGVFYLEADRREHPLRAFDTYEQALRHAADLAKSVHVNVWWARQLEDRPTPIVSYRPL